MASAAPTVKLTQHGNQSRERSNEYETVDDDEESLSKSIMEKMVTSGFNLKDEFLPNGFIEENITTVEIQRELGPNECAELVEWVDEHAKKLFVIVVLCGVKGANLRDSMRGFHKSHYTDKKLPLQNFEKRISPFVKDVWAESLMRKRFFTQQWSLLAPVFGLKYQYNLSGHSILPFTRKDDQPRVGSFGEVYRVVIHDAHREEGIPSTVSRAVALHRVAHTNTSLGCSQTSLPQGGV